MTSTETRAPRKRAPRKAAPPVEAGEKPGVDHRKAEAAREQLEAGGQQVTAGAVRRIRERASAAADRTVAGAFAMSDAARAAREAAEADVPLPVEPGPEEDPDAAGQTGVADVAPRTARETAPRADAGDQVDELDRMLAAAPELTAEDREAIAGRADQLAAAQLDDDGAPSPATPPAELPAGVTACGPGDPTPADVAAIAAFAEQLEAAAADDDDDDEVDLRALSAIPLEAAEIDVRSLIAGRVATAPDGRRVTVLELDGVDVATFLLTDQQAAAVTAGMLDGLSVDTATGEVIDLDGAGDPTRVTLSAADAAAIEEARALEARAGELKEAAEAIRSRIKEQLGGETGRGEVAVDAAGRELARWTRVTSTKCSTTALKAARPEVWAEFATTTVSRRFTWAD